MSPVEAWEQGSKWTPLINLLQLIKNFDKDFNRQHTADRFVVGWT